MIEEFQPYIDKYGMLHSRPVINGEPSTQNGLLYTAEMVVAYCEKAQPTAPLRDYFEMILKQCEKEPGLYKRGPEFDGQEGPDDYVGIAAGCAFLSLHKPCEDIIAYGKKHWWYFNNTPSPKFNFSALFLRFPHLIAHFYYGAGLKPPLFFRFMWNVAVLFTTFTAAKHDQDKWIQTWLMITTKELGNKNSGLVIRIFAKRFHKLFPKGLKEVMGAYLNDPNHPLLKLL